jgi:hypothetical protein
VALKVVQNRHTITVANFEVGRGLADGSQEATSALSRRNFDQCTSSLSLRFRFSSENDVFDLFVDVRLYVIKNAYACDDALTLNRKNSVTLTVKKLLKTM